MPRALFTVERNHYAMNIRKQRICDHFPFITSLHHFHFMLLGQFNLGLLSYRFDFHQDADESNNVRNLHGTPSNQFATRSNKSQIFKCIHVCSSSIIFKQHVINYINKQKTYHSRPQVFTQLHSKVGRRSWSKITVEVSDLS